ncbi:MAG: hypothetical protein JJT93_15395, partial [Gammaproteobacteria bacterium]|nr:hypothetical protein [Gammaproteobacteria bacterium]
MIIPGLTRAASEPSGLPRRLRAWLARGQPLPVVPGGIDAVVQACAQLPPSGPDRLPAAPLMALGEQILSVAEPGSGPPPGGRGRGGGCGGGPPTMGRGGAP